MSFLPNVRIGTRLAIGFAIVLALSVLSISYALINARSNAHTTRSMMQGHLAKERLVSDWYVLVYSAIARTAMIARSSDDSLSVTFADVIAASSKNAGAIIKTVEPLLVADEEKSTYKSIVELRAKYQASKELVMNAKASGKTADAERLFSDTFMPAAKAYEARVLDLLSLERKAIDATGRAIDNANSRSVNVLILLGILSVVIGGACAFLIARSITRPLSQAVTVAETVASGDLTSHIESSARDETGQLMRALKNMNDSLATVVGEVRTGTDSITTASKEIASGNADLSSRTEEEASSLEETAASMEELTSAVKQNADSARQASQLAAGASEVAVKGGKVVSQVVITMSSINDSSKKIADIISVIDGIAFQTNILALNAAVEAARAGEQGRGFAVVATEVRTLAQRSAAAAKEMKELISDSVGKINDGTKLVDEAGQTMDEIVTAVKRVTGVMAEIAAASQEQSVGIDQVNQAVTQMDEATQQNAALVEEASAAAESMQEQAQNLTQAVAVFKLAPHEEQATADTGTHVAIVTHPPARKAAARGHAAAGKKPAASQARKVPMPSGARA